jgi:hypothetical protein
MNRTSLLFALLALSFFAIDPAFAAIRFKRFPACPQGAVPMSVRTCECHRGTSGRYRFCHGGNSCDTESGKCHK